jgi:alpha-ketoglutarate-dependent taurine dioxygenase
MTETVDVDLAGRWGLSGPRTLRRLAAGQEERPYELFEVRPLGPVLGAEVRGVFLGDPVGPELFAELDRALLEFKVLFFRDQRVTNAQHRAFALNRGELETHPFLPPAVHDFFPAFGRLLSPELAALKREEFPPVEHPVVRTHPRTVGGVPR